MHVDQRIGQNVARFRGDMTQQQLAERMRDRGWKWSQATVWAVEKGERSVRFAEAFDLAEILGIERLESLGSDAVTNTLMAAYMRLTEAEKALLAAARTYDDARVEFGRAAVHANDYGIHMAEAPAITARTPEDAISRALSRGVIVDPPETSTLAAELTRLYGEH